MAELERYRDVFTACFGKTYPKPSNSLAKAQLSTVKETIRDR